MDRGTVVKRETQRCEDEPGHRFEVIQFSRGRMFVASINERVGDWAVYTGPGPNWREVRTRGDKIGALEAAQLFPTMAGQFRYRN